jgi:hypothetical protein
MDCPICTPGKDIPTESVERHLASEQHGVDPNIAKIIAYLNERVDRLEKLEQQIQ